MMDLHLPPAYVQTAQAETPVPAAPAEAPPIKVDVANKNYALIEVVILPVSSKVKSQIFMMEMIKVGKGSKSHWVVNSWAPRSVPTIPNNPSGS